MTAARKRHTKTRDSKRWETIYFILALWPGDSDPLDLSHGIQDAVLPLVLMLITYFRDSASIGHGMDSIGPDTEAIRRRRIPPARSARRK